jgi:hypothetical protein
MYAGATAVLFNHVCCPLLLLQVKVKGARKITWPEFVKALDHIAAKKVRQQHEIAQGWQRVLSHTLHETPGSCIMAVQAAVALLAGTTASAAVCFSLILELMWDAACSLLLTLSAGLYC